VTSSKFDPEIETLIGAALYDMERVGVNPALLQVDAETGGLENRFVKQAVVSYCKAQFGYDNSEASRFENAYTRIVIDLLNSSENIAAIAKEVADAESVDDGSEPLVGEPAVPDGE